MRAVRTWYGYAKKSPTHDSRLKVQKLRNQSESSSVFLRGCTHLLRISTRSRDYNPGPWLVAEFLDLEHTHDGDFTGECTNLKLENMILYTVIPNIALVV